MDVAFEWSKGEKSFAEVCDMTDVFEGAVVRSLRRLVELLDNLHGCLEALGDGAMGGGAGEGIREMPKVAPPAKQATTTFVRFDLRTARARRLAKRAWR